MALPVRAFVYEFLYRGQPAGSTQAPSYHAVLGVTSTDEFGNPRVAYSKIAQCSPSAT
jgi:hypothetical protein